MVSIGGSLPAGQAPLSSSLATATLAVNSPFPPLVERMPAQRSLSHGQIEAIRSAMQLFVDDDLARGVRRTDRMYCDACQRPRPAAGVIRYGRYALCNCCATEYEVARAKGALASPGQFVRDKHFGEDERYVIAD
ncbi:MAG TPA: hypothetical protein VFD32_11555 [Dehalococcoidia bacterium]|nr:hypothetical protein [Dehalococcoidia bacterium]